MLGAFPRGPGMERKDLLAKNCAIFKAQGRLLDELASKNVKVVVVSVVNNRNILLCCIFMLPIDRSAIRRIPTAGLLSNVLLRSLRGISLLSPDWMRTDRNLRLLCG
jgi:malate/lactate dehydrogenase